MPVSSAKKRNLLDSNTRPGADPELPENRKDGPPRTGNALKGLALSEIQLKPLDWFRYNPDNDIFRGLKTDEYFKSLEKDIRDANAIVNPVIAMPDGLLVEGESRHGIASKLCNEGNASFAKIPARIILSPMAAEKITERLYLGNLSRFDIPAAVRLYAYSKIWPEFFLEITNGGRGNTITTKKEIAAATGLSESQIKRNKAVVRKAAAIAEKEKAPLEVKHLEMARKEGKQGAGEDRAGSKRKNVTGNNPEGKAERKIEREKFRGGLRDLFTRHGAYFDFAARFAAELHRGGFIGKENFVAIKKLVAETKALFMQRDGKNAQGKKKAAG
jgi:hypothetical protein